MPGEDLSDLVNNQPCRRCKENDAVLVVRSEPLCHNCFIKYVNTKTIKRMESFRVRNAHPDHPRKLLLALSLGVSSLALLHILDQHLKTQQSKTGRTGFALDIVFIEPIDRNRLIQANALLSRVRSAYPSYKITSKSAHRVFDELQDDHGLIRVALRHGIMSTGSPEERLTALLNALPSASARADVNSIIVTRLIVATAKANGCESVIWGHSTTKLAEKTLAETAKGRGFSLPWQIADGMSPFGVAFHYPLRDVLKKELVSYVHFIDSTLSSFILDPCSTTVTSMSSKNTTIDDLMKQYVRSVEENFPSIVSNVVRTSGKLQANSSSSADITCDLCTMPVTDSRYGIQGWGGDQGKGIENVVAPSSNLCYGCTRAGPQEIASLQVGI